MKDLITEARELCEKATEGPWEAGSYGAVCLKSGFKLGNIEGSGNAAFIARSRTLIPELCDALEKAAQKNDELMRELSQLARESVERDKALAKMEAEVMATCNSVRWIPVSERLPTGCGYYLSVVERIAPDELGGNNTRVKIMRRLGADWRYPTHIPKWINEAITETVTHWMPLPAPPEEGAEHERD